VPNPIGGEAVSDVSSERDRVLHVVKHCDRGNDPRWGVADLVKLRSRKEVCDDLGIRRVVVREPRGGRVDSDSADTVGGVRSQERAIVAADVEHDVAGIEPD
jgi:hypothetical protein